MSRTRRTFITQGIAASGAGILSLAAGFGRASCLPRKALLPAAPHSLTDENFATLEAIGEVLLPGSAHEGIASYIDYQLSLPEGRSLLILRYLGVRPPFAEFYRTGLVGVEAAAKRHFGRPFNMLSAADSQALVAQISSGTLAAWNGPPAALFYFVLRSDAVDVVYGTQAGFQKLAVPYMAHIVPPSRWDESG
jgi:hypothetical protein